MMEEGLVEEVQRLKDMGLKEGMVSMQGLGYKEILEYLDGRCTLEDAVYRIKRDTRHFAKRQITWFKREREVIWIDKAACGYDDERIVETMLSHMKGVQGICSEDYSGAPKLLKRMNPLMELYSYSKNAETTYRELLALEKYARTRVKRRSIT